MLLTTSIRKFYCLPLILTLAFTGLLSGCGSSDSPSDATSGVPATVELDKNTVWFDFIAGDTAARSKIVKLTTNKNTVQPFLITDDGDPRWASALSNSGTDTPADIEITVTPDGSAGSGTSQSEIFTFSIDGHTNTTLSVNYSEDIHKIMVSDSPDRSNPRLLENEALSGNAYIFVAPNDDIDIANFHYDEPSGGTPYQKEVAIWFDFERTIESDPALPANPFDTTNIPNAGGNGPHYIIVEIITDDGYTKELRSDFTISN